MKIGILQCGHFPDELLGETGDYDTIFPRFLDGYGFDFAIYPVVDNVFPDGPDDCDGWLITGSRFGAYEDHAWIPPLENLIRAIQQAHKPLIGVCFGHQIIAQALGGRVEKVARGWAVGRQTYDFDGEEMALNAFHQDQVVELPDGAQVLASNDFCPYAALAYDGILTVQPHPEFDKRELGGLLRERAPDLIDAAMLERATRDLALPVDNREIANRFAAFLKGTPQ